MIEVPMPTYFTEKQINDGMSLVRAIRELTLRKDVTVAKYVPRDQIPSRNYFTPEFEAEMKPIKLALRIRFQELHALPVDDFYVAIELLILTMTAFALIDNKIAIASTPEGIASIQRTEREPYQGLTSATYTRNRSSTSQPQTVAAAPVFCKDCKHYDDTAFKDAPKCLAPQARTINLVRGYQNPPCHKERLATSLGTACGPDGALFLQASTDGIASALNSVGNAI